MGNIASNLKYRTKGSKKLTKQVIVKTESEDQKEKYSKSDLCNEANSPKQSNGIIVENLAFNTYNCESGEDNIVFARNSYTAMSFRKGEKLEVLQRSDPIWWTVKRLDTGETGYIPSNYVRTATFESEAWYCDCIGYKAEYPIGRYMFRISEHNTDNKLKSYTLSIRNLKEMNPNRHYVDHYEIHETESGKFLLAGREFPTLQDIIRFYATQPTRPGRSLVHPCTNFWENLLLGKSDEIDKKDIKLIKLLGCGNYGTVFYGSLLDQKEVAIKRLKPINISPQKFRQKSEIMRRCRHNNLVKYYGVCSREEPFLIITEFVKNGDLLEYLRNSEEVKSLKLPDLIDMCTQVASGMSYLESIGLVHRELAARNILVGDNNEVKVGDFGLALIINEPSEFPVKWIAPEAALFGKYSSKSDVWSYGILLYEVITRGQIPYPGMNQRDFREQVFKWKYRMPKPLVDCPDSYYEMMLKCWHEMPDNRPTFEYLWNFFDHYFDCTEQKNMKENGNKDQMDEQV